MRFKKNVLLSFVILLIAISCLNSKSKNLKELRQEFLELKFGMFIHFNMGTYYEVEWVEPGKDPMSFNPKKLDIGQWADAAKSAKMNYAVLTVKHHDGFCLWDSETTDYDIASTPLAGRDLVKEYCDEFRKRGIEPHLYFSIWDRTLGIEKLITAEDKVKIKIQLKELLTKYGKIRTLTIDGWGNCGTEWTIDDYNEISGYAKSLQPELLITDHFQMQRVFHLKTISLEEAYSINDFLHFEEPLGEWAWAPEGNSFASHQGPTLQSKWFWKKSFPSEDLMPIEEIVDGHLGVLKNRNCNLLLNVAPNPDGLLDQNVIEHLYEVGLVYNP